MFMTGTTITSLEGWRLAKKRAAPTMAATARTMAVMVMIFFFFIVRHLPR